MTSSLINKKKFFIGVIILAVLYIPIEIGFLIGHQIYFSNHTDKEFLRVIDCKYANAGIILLIMSKSRIKKVVRQQSIFHIYPYWRSVYRDFPTDKENIYILAVPYRFDAAQEWYLELFSEDGHWISLSPYFTEKPELPDDVWDQIWSESQNKKLKIEDWFANSKSNFN